MTFMLWKNEYLTGIADLDTQHQSLLETTNKLHEGVHNPNPDNKSITEIIDNLIDYTYNHFVMEESLIEQYGYANADTHKTEHNKFTTLVMQLMDTFENGDPIDDAMLQIKDMLDHHLLEADMEFVQFLKSKGVN